MEIGLIHLCVRNTHRCKRGSSIVNGIVPVHIIAVDITGIEFQELDIKQFIRYFRGTAFLNIYVQTFIILLDLEVKRTEFIAQRQQREAHVIQIHIFLQLAVTHLNLKVDIQIHSRLQKQGSEHFRSGTAAGFPFI